jgi:hypothetical protein
MAERLVEFEETFLKQKDFVCGIVSASKATIYAITIVFTSEKPEVNRVQRTEAHRRSVGVVNIKATGRLKNAIKFSKRNIAREVNNKPSILQQAVRGKVHQCPKKKTIVSRQATINIYQNTTARNISVHYCVTSVDVARHHCKSTQMPKCLRDKTSGYESQKVAVGRNLLECVPGYRKTLKETAGTGKSPGQPPKHWNYQYYTYKPGEFNFNDDTYTVLRKESCTIISELVPPATAKEQDAQSHVECHVLTVRDLRIQLHARAAKHSHSLQISRS